MGGYVQVVGTVVLIVRFLLEALICSSGAHQFLLFFRRIFDSFPISLLLEDFLFT